MSGVKGLIFITLASLLFFALVVAAVEWDDISRLSAVSEQTSREMSGRVAALVREEVESGRIGLNDDYLLYEFAKKHNIFRIAIYNSDGAPINDTSGAEISGKKPLIEKEEIISALKGGEKFFRKETGERHIGVYLSSLGGPRAEGLRAEGGPHAIMVALDLPSGRAAASTTIIAVAGAAIVFLFLLWAVMRVYTKEQQRDLGGAGETSEVGFVVDTFHGLVAALKGKERELEVLRSIAEDRAAEIEGYNEDILESVTSGVVSLDESNRVTKVNSSAEKILEIKRAYVFGKEVPEAFSGRLAELLSGGESIERGEMEHISPSGRRLWLGFNLVPLLDKDKNIIGRLFVFTDLTELKALGAQAELRQRLSSLGEMAAGIAHELRNPMAVIAGYAKLLGRQLEGAPLKTVESISKEVSVMDKIINDFLSFARPGEPRLSQVDLHGLISDSARSLIGERKDIEFSLQMDGPSAIEADEVLLRQAFTNLIQNSIEAMPEGGKITIKSAGENKALVISFSDTGHGIPDAVKDKIFLPFFTTKERGTGLGLAIAHRTIAQHGGTIEVVDIAGAEKGTAFRITLPKKR